MLKKLSWFLKEKSSKMSKRLWKNLRLKMEVFYIWYNRNNKLRRITFNNNNLQPNNLNNRPNNNHNNRPNNSLNNKHSRTWPREWVYLQDLTCLHLDKERWISTKWIKCYKIQWWDKWLRTYLAILTSWEIYYKWVLRFNKWLRIIHNYKDLLVILNNYQAWLQWCLEHHNRLHNKLLYRLLYSLNNSSHKIPKLTHQCKFLSKHLRILRKNLKINYWD